MELPSAGALGHVRRRPRRGWCASPAASRRAGACWTLPADQGRHSRYLAGLGLRVAAVDRDPQAIAALTGVAGVRPTLADIEGGPWPYAGECFDGVVVTNYLHRPLLSVLRDSLLPGGVLIYETFARRERTLRPAIEPGIPAGAGRAAGAVPGSARHRLRRPVR